MIFVEGVSAFFIVIPAYKKSIQDFQCLNCNSAD